jgi:hypothetical protein
MLALLVGLAAGYHWGYGDGVNGGPSIISRTLDRFGASQIRAEQAENDKRIDDAGKP